MTVAALYQFAPFENPEALQRPLLVSCQKNGLKGSLLLAREGINGTICGPGPGIEAVVSHIRALPHCEALEVKFSTSAHMPFWRMKVKLKKEIVTLGVEGIDPSREVGRYVEAAEWNRTLEDPNVVVIDTRNDYEVNIGTFANAVNPETKTFRDFPAWFRAFKRNLSPNTKVAMFCTGGIRCEKATAFLKSEGVADVVHLKGGILKYLETIPATQSLWRGECFVFDQRVSVGQELSAGTYGQCYGCRKPLSQTDQQSAQFIQGVQCPHCAGARDNTQRARYAERERQMQLAQERGQAHLGDE
jgi:UPF0176 protein